MLTNTSDNDKKSFKYFVDSDLEKILARDETALNELFSGLNPKLLRLLASQGFFGESAEELIHESWEVFFGNLEKFEGRSQLKTFITGILINKIRENRRRLKKLELFEDAEDIFKNKFNDGGWWVQEPKSPEQLLENKQVGHFIGDCMNILTDNQRQAFSLIAIEGEDTNLVCNILDISVTNLRVLIFRAKESLRKCLEIKIGS